MEKPKSARLPSEYQEVEYLQSTGTQYIKTGVTLTNAQKIFVKTEFKISETATDDNAILCGRDGGNLFYKQFKFPNWCNSAIEVR